jgi:photosystem II stability/assembly factor-like uncharacterized protein
MRKALSLSSMAILALVGVVLAIGPSLAQRRSSEPSATGGLKFRFMGPAVGNRIAAAVGVSGDPNTYYAGAASGGVWKSTDAGVHWTPIFDDQPVAAIGSLAIAPSDPSIVWAGTGEAWAIRDSDMIGDGIYRSTDAGATWTHMGLDETGRIGRIIVHPADPDIVFAAALGRLTGPQQERGVFRTTDGGRTWKRVLFVDANTGCSGLAMDPKDPNILFAGMWQVEMHTYAMFGGGPGSGLYVSRDGGTTWKRLEGHGLPRSPLGKIDVAIAPGTPKRIYALIQTADQGSVWRSDDGGLTWQSKSWQRALIGRAGYYIRLAVSPSDPDNVFVANSSFHESTDGGRSFRPLAWGGDTHDIWIDPTNAGRILVTDDGGMYMTTDHGKTSRRIFLPIGQMYHVAVDHDVPYHIYSNMQDDGTMRGLSTTAEAAPGAPAAGGSGYFGRGGASNFGVWDHGLGGCESGFTIPDPTDSNIIWATCYGLEVTRYDYRTKLARSVAPWMHTLDSEPNKLKYRAHWTPPLAIDPFDHNTVYFGAQVIFRTTDGGTSWSVISPDLSTQDPRRIVPSGGLVGDNLGQFYGEVVFAIAPSEVQKGLIWAGTNDGKVWNTTDGGATWNDLTKNITGLPPWGVVSRIEPSSFDAGTAYLAVDFHLMDNRDPWLYKTTDLGKTWAKISGDLPTGGPLTYARVVAENPNRKGMLFAGTGNALYYTLDDGAHWKRLKEGLPPAPVSWIVVQKEAHDLVVSTYGRGLYIMEDITPLEQGKMEGAPAEAVDLIAPRPAYRLARGGRAILSYVLKDAPGNPPQVEILDRTGAMIRRISNAAGAAGLNRIAWDLRYGDGPKQVALRTTPPENPHIWEEPRFKGAQVRRITHWGVRALPAPMAAPGLYAVRLTVDGRTATQPLELRLPPDAHATDAEIQDLVKLQLRVRDDLDEVADMTNTIEWLRRQIEDANKATGAAKIKPAAAQALAAFDKKMRDVEYAHLITRSEALSDDKFFVERYKLYLNLVWTYQVIGPGGGDVAGSADYGPTATAVGLVDGFEKEIAETRGLYRRLVDVELPLVNARLAKAGLAPLKTTGAPAPGVPAKLDLFEH